MIRYTLTLDRPSTHLFHVSIDLETGGEEFIDLEFPAWSPGRYFIYDFARNVQNLGALSADGSALPFEKIRKGTWRIDCRGADAVRLEYRMYGDTLGGTFSQLDDRHAAINGSSVFGYIVGRIPEPIELEIAAPSDWKIYTSLRKRRRNGRTLYAAENYDLLIDSPIEIGNPIARKFILDGITYHVVVDIASGSGAEKSAETMKRIDRFTADTEKTVAAYTATFGRPEFDAYYFLVNIDPYAPNGDGMEHLASTRLVINGFITDDDHYNDLVGVMSHEFFHIWNVKRMRPAELGPFEYDRESHTTLLWFAEGFTQYYGHLMARRGGAWDDRHFYKTLAGEINMVDRSPGRAHRNLRESSFDTWHMGSARNPAAGGSNYRNTYVNYYHKGAVAALALDMEIRRLTGDRKSLDDLMIRLYETSYADTGIGDYFLRGRGYTEHDIYDAVEAVAGPEALAFLRRMVETTDEIDYEGALSHVGLKLQRGREARKEEKPLPPFTGIIVADPKSRGTRELISVANVLAGSPAEAAGLSVGDVLLALDGDRVDGRTWEQVMETRRSGETIEITLFRGPRLLTLRMKTDERDTRPFRIETDKNAVTARKRSLKRWLSGK